MARVSDWYLQTAVRVGDSFVDGSVRRQLIEMKNVILNAPVDQRLWEGVPA